MKWAPTKATRNPTNAEAIRWGHLAKLRVYQMEMEKHYGNTGFPHLGPPDSVPSAQRMSWQRDAEAGHVGV